MKYKPAHDTYSKTCVTSMNSEQFVHPSSTVRVLVYPSLDSLEDEEGTCDKRWLWSDCSDAQADLFRWSHVLFGGFVLRWLIFDGRTRGRR